jgi:ATP-binding cassette subfamily F protein 3
VEPFDGDLDDYQRYLLDEAKRQREAIKEASSRAAKEEAQAAAALQAAIKAQGTGKVNKSKAQRELTQVEERMKTLNAEGATLESHLVKSVHPVEIADLGKRLNEVNAELQSLEEKWLEMSTA